MVEFGFLMQRSSGTIAPAFTEKINEEHITRILDISEKVDERIFKDAQSTKKYIFMGMLILCGIFVFATVFLVKNDPSAYKELLKSLAIFVGGFGGGFGLKSYIVGRNKER